MGLSAVRRVASGVCPWGAFRARWPGLRLLLMTSNVNPTTAQPFVPLCRPNFEVPTPKPNVALHAKAEVKRRRKRTPWRSSGVLV